MMQITTEQAVAESGFTLRDYLDTLEYGTTISRSTSGETGHTHHTLMRVNGEVFYRRDYGRKGYRVKPGYFRDNRFPPTPGIDRAIAQLSL